MVWRRIKEITWFESSNPGTFTIQIKYDPTGVRGAMCKNWLRSWVPALVEICKRFLQGAIPQEKTVNVAQKIRSTVKELKTP